MESELVSKILEVLNHPSDVQIKEWRSELWTDKDDHLPLWFVLIRQIPKTQDQFIIDLYNKIIGKSSISELVRYTNAAFNTDIPKSLAGKYNNIVLHPSVFNGPYKESNTKRYYGWIIDLMFSPKNTYSKDTIDVIKLYFDIKPKPNHTIVLDEKIIDEILLTMYFNDEDEVLTFRGFRGNDSQVIINMGKYIIEEGWSLERVITQLININARTNILVYFLNKYSNRISMDKIYYYIKENKINTTNNWNKIILNQV